MNKLLVDCGYIEQKPDRQVGINSGLMLNKYDGFSPLFAVRADKDSMY